MSQQEENVEIDSPKVEQYDYNFPNTNIGKSSLAFYFGVGVPYVTSNLADYYKQKVDLTMALDYYHHNNLTFSFHFMFADGNLRKEIDVNNRLWTPQDTLKFKAWGLSIGYSVLNRVHWRVNPFGGVVLSKSELVSSSGNKYKTGLKPSPLVGVNFSYRFINIKEEMQRGEYSGASGCLGINARVAYVPFAVNKKNVPFSGGILYMTIGITMNIF